MIRKVLITAVMGLTMWASVLGVTYADEGIISSTATDAFEEDNTPADAVELPLDGSAQHRNFGEEGDEDWVTVALQAGVVYAFYAVPYENAPTQPVLALFAEEDTDTPITLSRRRADGSALLLWTPSTSGTYFLRASEETGAGSALYTYTLQAGEFYRVLGFDQPLRQVGRRTN